MFWTEYFTEYILQKYIFKILGKQYYGDPHSIFYATEKSATAITQPPLINKYQKHKELFMNFINYHLQLVEELNKKMQASQEPVYLFGAHIFSQFLIQFGLNTDKIIGVLDNSPMKQGKRLYGTQLKVDSPKILKDQGKANIILKAGIYDQEIKKDILENINSKISIW